MVIKRGFYINNPKQRTCPKCGQRIEKFKLKDNRKYTCEACEQVWLIDIYEDRCYLTMAERPEIRHRHVEYIRKIGLKELIKARTEAKKWKEIAQKLAEEKKQPKRQKEGMPI